MSRGPGRVERAIEAAFQAAPIDKRFTVKRLAQIVYHAGSTTAVVTEAQRVSVARAASKTAEGLGWRPNSKSITAQDAEEMGERPGRFVYFEHRDRIGQVGRRIREERGLPPIPTSEEVEAASAARIKRNEEANAKEMAIKQEWLDEFRRLKAKREALDIEGNEIDAAMELIVARSRLANG